MAENSPRLLGRSDQYKAKGAMAPFADDMNKLVNHQVIQSGNCSVTHRNNRTVIHVPYPQFHLGSFWYGQSGTNGNTITVKAGWVTIHGKIDIEVAEDTVTLTGNPEYVYIEHVLDSGVATIEHASTFPPVTSNIVRQRLYRFALNSKSKWILTNIYHYGDVVLGAFPR